MFDIKKLGICVYLSMKVCQKRAHIVYTPTSVIDQTMKWNEVHSVANGPIYVKTEYSSEQHNSSKGEAVWESEYSLNRHHALSEIVISFW